MTQPNVSDASFWQSLYQNHQTGWDAKDITTPLKTYFDQLTNRDQRILIPGAGNAHEGAYLHTQGFEQVYLLDFVQDPLDGFAEQYPDFPRAHLLCQDFFTLDTQKLDRPFDLIIEQTFLCAIDPYRRSEYAQKMHDLLAPQGKLIGVLLDGRFEQGPPFAGSKAEYHKLFAPYFDIEILEPCYNSIAPRAGKELFVKLIKR